MNYNNLPLQPEHDPSLELATVFHDVAEVAIMYGRVVESESGGADDAQSVHEFTVNEVPDDLKHKHPMLESFAYKTAGSRDGVPTEGVVKIFINDGVTGRTFMLDKMFDVDEIKYSFEHESTTPAYGIVGKIRFTPESGSAIPYDVATLPQIASDISAQYRG